MKKTKTILLACCFSLFGIGGYAQAPVTVYTGSSLPTEQGWNELKLDNTVSAAAAQVTQTLGNGALKLSSVNAVDQFSQLGWYKTGLGLNLSAGYTIEIKAKLTASQKGSFNIQGYDNEGKGFRVSLGETQLINQSSPLDPSFVIASDLTNDSEFHIYRLAVASSGIVTVYRDLETIGTFPLAAFQFDNLITNGGFEDGNDDLNDLTVFPDILSANGLLYRTDLSSDVHTGEYALVINSDGKNNGTIPKEGATTRSFPIKPGTKYDVSFDHRNLIQDNEWAWRDFGGYWNTQLGSVNNPDENASNPNMFWWNNPFEPKEWISRAGDFTTPANEPAINAVRFEFPSWIRENNKNTSIVAIDNFVIREHTDLKVGPQVATANINPAFPEEYVNLIANGGFEDWEKNNDGSDYTWALSNPSDGGDNNPTANNPLWNGNVRIQRHDQSNDEIGGVWAHSGISSVRFSTLGNRNNNFNFTKELEANKTYRFSFWHRSPKYDDWGWLKVKIGEGGDEKVIWGHELKGRNNRWTNADLVFTTTDTDKTLHLFTDFESHGDWWNLYLDDFVLYEIPTGTPLDPQIAGKINLIDNGDFEDTTIDNTGAAYEWALASSDPADDKNYPVAWNDQWGSYVRLQDKRKHIDSGFQWAHSGNKSLRFSFLDDKGQAQSFEGISGDEQPSAYRVNLNFNKELEPNKTYTFVFWIKASNYPDRGRFVVANGDLRILEEELSTQFVNWTRQSITFSTTEGNHTLRIFTEFGGWFNFYLDDLFLYEEEVYVPFQFNGETYLFFGKSTGTQSTDVEIKYVKIDNTGAYAPSFYTVTYHLNGGEGATDATYPVEDETITLPIPTKTAYTFLGWYDNSELDGSAVTEIPNGSTGNKEYWAKWEAIAYTITYHSNEGTGATNSTYTIESETQSLPTPTKADYTFLGWYDNSELTGSAVTEIPQGSTGDKEFWAKWDIVSGINDVNGKLQLYPNPVVDGNLTIENSLPENGKIEIYNLLGTLTGAYEITGSRTVIDISNLPAGTYLVKVNGKIAKLLKK
ncbi:MAG: hypothetical protein EZS26_000908 [Candidatus Ordinivivax streblomastigis]|uniref:Secretion system C-terminal sorting domain-containing protein n=1 Tax=Candidatus Ordinivivax streblomastigis TaxID=2540710 RepID=A0A5M8P3H2_9BACT|nr:MAG: hypothetical protein EZS26_000908 [Candidatus Ordinivivax streblomastigis]